MRDTPDSSDITVKLIQVTTRLVSYVSQEKSTRSCINKPTRRDGGDLKNKKKTYNKFVALLSRVLTGGRFRSNEFTVYPGDFDASRRRKETVPSFSTPQAGRLQESEAPIVMKRVVAGFVVAVDRDTLETVDGPACEPGKLHKVVLTLVQNEREKKTRRKKDIS